LMESEGFEEMLVWRQSCVSGSNRASDEVDGKKAKTASERQADQTIRDETSGWKRCYAKAPDDPDAGEIVAMVARAIESPFVRKAIRIAVARPQTVFVGERVLVLTGIQKWIIRWLVQSSDEEINGETQ
jgi:hypothetical protein